MRGLPRRPPLPDLRGLDDDDPVFLDDGYDDEEDRDVDDEFGSYPAGVPRNDPDGYDRGGAFDGRQVISDAEGGL
jgi:hypothetical protein